MNKIINGKRYDTETSKQLYLLKSYTTYKGIDMKASEGLFKTKKNEYFLVAKGYIGEDSYFTGFEKHESASPEEITFEIIDEETAKVLLMAHGSGDEYEHEFGKVKE